MGEAIEGELRREELEGEVEGLEFRLDVKSPLSDGEYSSMEGE